MEGKTASRFGFEIQEKTQRTNQEKLVGSDGPKNTETERSHPRVGQLLQNRRYETKAQRDRRTVTNAHEDSHMETVENERAASVGIAKTRSARVDGKAVSEIRGPLSSGSENHGTAPHKQRNPCKTRTSKLFGLLLELNRRMPNGTYGGVRGATC